MATEKDAVYHRRLRDMIDSIKAKSDLHLTLERKADLDAHTTGYLALQISDIMDDQVKSLLGAPNPPTVEELQRLRHNRGLE